MIATFGEIFLWLTMAALLVLGLAYVLRPAEGVERHMKETILAFIAFFFSCLDCG